MLALTAIWALLLPVALFAQAGTEGSFFGTVVDSSGSAIPGAIVAVSNLETGFSRTVTTGQEGQFSLSSLPIGPYTISVTATGFKKWQLTRTELSVGDR